MVETRLLGGQSGCQNRLFYSYDLEDDIARAHLLRIDRLLHLSDLRHHLVTFYTRQVCAASFNGGTIETACIKRRGKNDFVLSIRVSE